MTDRRYDPNPTVDGDDPQAYAQYAERLDQEAPTWYFDDVKDMAPGLAEQALFRRLSRPQPPKAQPLTPFITPLQQGAVAAFELFDSYVKAGFQRPVDCPEALILLLDVLRDAREQNRRDRGNGGGS